MQQLSQQLINGLVLGAIYALIAVGYTMVYGVLRLINFAHGDVIMVGAVLAFYAVTRWFKLPLEPADARDWHVLLGASGAAAAGALAWFFVTRSRSRTQAGSEATDMAGGEPSAAPADAPAVAESPQVVEEAAPATEASAEAASEPAPAVAGASSVLPKKVLFSTVGWLAVLAVAYTARRWFRPGDSQTWAGFLAVLVVAMVGAGMLGFMIEFIAYRPLRNQPRINALITAIGVSMLLEFGFQNPVIFGPSPEAFPSEIVPRLLPGTPQRPWVARTWERTVNVPDGSGFQAVRLDRRVECIGRAVRVTWTSPRFDAQPSAYAGLANNEVSVGAIDLLILTSTLLLMFALMLVVQRTRTGLALRAVSYRFDTSSLMGINVNRIVSFTFVLGSTLAGAAGVLYVCRYPKVESFMGLIPGLKAFVAAVLGGIGNIPGAVLGAFLLGVVETMVAGFLPQGSQYQDAIAFAILIVVLLLKPAGLLGRASAEKV